MKAGARLAQLGDRELLGLGFRELGLSLTGRGLMGRVLRGRLARLGRELGQKGLQFRPHAWLSTEFFSPDGLPGMALPFYLAHPRLMRLERRLTQECEAQRDASCMRILRHETGHAIDNAFGLHRRASWRRVFGRFSEPYRRDFQVHPSDPNFVRYLPNWYAQSHPAEDFAESFAFWLDPSTRRPKESLPGSVARKLQWVEECMGELAASGASGLVSKEEWEPVQSSPQRLSEHYSRRLRDLACEPEPPFAAQLAERLKHAGHALERSSAAHYLRVHSAAIRAHLPAHWRSDSYSMEQVLRTMQIHCRRRGLRLDNGDRALSRRILARLVAETLVALEQGNHTLRR